MSNPIRRRHVNANANFPTSTLSAFPNENLPSTASHYDGHNDEDDQEYDEKDGLIHSGEHLEQLFYDDEEGSPVDSYFARLLLLILLLCMIYMTLFVFMDSRFISALFATIADLFAGKGFHGDYR